MSHHRRPAVHLRTALAWTLCLSCITLTSRAEEEPQPDAEPAKQNVHLLAMRGAYADLPQSMGLDVTSLLQGPVNQKPFYRLCE